MAENESPPLEVQLASAQRELHRMKHGAVNAGFVQVSKMYIAEMKELGRYAQSASQILWTLIEEMNKQNSVMISVPSLSLLTNMSQSSVKRALSLLREQQWIEVLKIGTSNVYRVNSQVVWQDRADGKWASFDARLVVNWDEQDAATKRAPSVRTRHIPLVEADDAVNVVAKEPAPAQKQLPLDE